MDSVREIADLWCPDVGATEYEKVNNATKNNKLSGIFVVA